MFSADEKNKLRPKVSNQPPEPGGDSVSGQDNAATLDRDIGIALRRVYQDAASEQVPSDLLDLLSKLD